MRPTCRLTPALGGNLDAERFIEMHRTALTQAEAEGLTSIPTSTLHTVFDDFEKHVVTGNGAPNPLELEKFRSDLAGSLAYQEHVHNWSLESFKQVIALGQSTLKTVMLKKTGVALHVLTSLTGATSMGAFLWGAKITYHGFTALAP